MIPRKRIDIGLADLASGVLACMAPGDVAAVRAGMEAAWDARANLACLSVRSGFDACAAEATRAFSRLIYLPAHEGMSGADIERLADAVAEFEQQHKASAY